MSCRAVQTLVDQVVAETISEVGCSDLARPERAALEASLVEIYGETALAFVLRMLPQDEAHAASLKLADLGMRDQQITNLLTYASSYLRELKSELLKTQSEIKTIHKHQLQKTLCA